MFGVKEPNFYGAVEVSTAKALLFMPRLPEEFAVWMGRLHSTDDVKKMYSVDEVHYIDDVSRTMTYRL
jgi:Xaa-Pro dipeptidase